MKSLDKTYRQSHLGNKQFAYDGSKSAYTAGPLPFPSKDFVVKLEDNDRSTRLVFVCWHVVSDFQLFTNFKQCCEFSFFLIVFHFLKKNMCIHS